MSDAEEIQYKRGKTLISGKEISDKVRVLADDILKDTPGDSGLLVVGILNGAAFFLSDLVRHMPPDFDVKIDFMAISSYGDDTKTSGAVRILKDIGSDIEGRNVLIVEDIIDTGLTLSYLLEILHARKPASLRTCVLLDKHERRKTPVKLDYRGFVIPDAFVVGYGLDCA